MWGDLRDRSLVRMIAALAVLAAGCAERALGIPEDPGGARDQSVSVDLTRVLDLSLVDLTRPPYCDGIYLVDRDARFVFFDPVKNTLTDVATLSCPAAASSLPWSMALARDGIAWVEYDDGRIYRVESDTGACTATSFVPDQQGYSNFGMGFAADTLGGSTETLFIAEVGGEHRLGRIDLATLTVHALPALPNDAELTGTGDAELWGFFRSRVGHVGRIDKITAAVSPDFALTQLGDLANIGWAFGFYGGAFYAFTYKGASSTSIHRIDRTTGAITTVLTDTGYSIVGAGVSTCAPTS